jgi:hypothetical protein
MTHRSPVRIAAIAAVALSLLLGLTGCGTEPLTGTVGKDIKALPASTLPKTLNGLTVKAENVKKGLKQASHSYVDAVGFFTLRQARVVQGTIQISHFGPSARLSSKEFRNQIIAQASPGQPASVNIAGQSISQSLGTKSTVSIWYSKGRLVVLTVLLSYPSSRGLLEQALVALPTA